MRPLWIVLRAAAAVLVVVAVAATLVTARGPVHPFDFFGYFTIQSNLVAAAAFAVGAFGLARGRAAAPLFRGAATVYIGLTGVVYNTLLAGLAGGVVLPWANSALHAVVPLYAALDWLLVDDRQPLPWRRLWTVLPYPAVWVVVVLIRGATDGWVPYPFLNPSQGYGVVAAYCLLITGAVVLLAVVVWALSRLHLLRPLPAGTRKTAAGIA